MTDKNLTTTRFREFSISPDILAGIEKCGFEFCTPIQAETLPITLQGRDIAGQAQTGTGKSLAFLLALLNRLHTHPPHKERKVNQPRAIILAPTRELAIQIHKDAVSVSGKLTLKIGLVYGGTGYEQQKKMLEEGLDILIGTPGRIIDFFKQHLFNLHQIEVTVMDEADRMFDLGFIKDIRYLLRRMPDPEKRLNMLFSATLSHRVMELAYEHMNNPELVEIVPETVTADRIVQSVYYPATEEKIPLLLTLLKEMQPQRSIIFINTKREAERLWCYLEGNNYPTAVLSGDVPQKKRQQLLQKFADGEYPILVATDVAARGLHIPDVTHIFNYDLPQDAEDYVHRIGRTARAGASGHAISFACEKYAYSLMDIEEYISQKIPVSYLDPSDLIKPEAPKRAPQRSTPHHKGRRKPSGSSHGSASANSRHQTPHKRT